MESTTQGQRKDVHRNVQRYEMVIARALAEKGVRPLDHEIEPITQSYWTVPAVKSETARSNTLSDEERSMLLRGIQWWNEGEQSGLRLIVVDYCGITSHQRQDAGSPGMLM